MPPKLVKRTQLLQGVSGQMLKSRTILRPAIVNDFGYWSQALSNYNPKKVLMCDFDNKYALLTKPIVDKSPDRFGFFKMPSSKSFLHTDDLITTLSLDPTLPPPDPNAVTSPIMVTGSLNRIASNNNLVFRMLIQSINRDGIFKYGRVIHNLIMPMEDWGICDFKGMEKIKKHSLMILAEVAGTIKRIPIDPEAEILNRPSFLFQFTPSETRNIQAPTNKPAMRLENGDLIISQVDIDPDKPVRQLTLKELDQIAMAYDALL
ncbi:hypothetical protein H4R33_006039 [Dimargaris cristalligena]|nr:hypothetical protein H4R33_006039 [Dimargaris cristalligena]